LLKDTGGTTGKSKGVELTHSNVFINALGHISLLDYSPKTRYLHSAPMFHLAGALHAAPPCEPSNAN